MNTLKIIYVVILSLIFESVEKQSKMIFQKDLSEQCRRRVMPSIFLGRQVVEANAQLMQFSRLEIPYSCFISIRTESGSNVIMMIQLAPYDLSKACSKNSEQLLVYEMGETFGGYWGPLPDSVMKREPLPPKVYTLKTTQHTTTKPSSSEEQTETEKTELTTVPDSIAQDNTEQESTGDYIEVEVPLLNVSVHLVAGNGGTKLVETDENSDDVTPIRGVDYDRSILPLVQFHLVEKPEEQQSRDDEHPKYELDVVQEFTPDLRLTLPRLSPTSKRRNEKQMYPSTRRLNFKKHRTLFNSHRHDSRTIPDPITRRMNYVTKYEFPTIKTTENKPKHNKDSWQVIHELMKNLDKNKEKNGVGTTRLSVDDAMLLENISNMNHSLSVYLAPNLSVYNSHNSKHKSNNNAKLSTRKLTSLLVEITNKSHKMEDTVTERSTEMMSPIVIIDDITFDRNLFNGTSESTELITETMSSLEETKKYQNPLTVAAFPPTTTLPIISISSKRENDEIFEMTSGTNSNTLAVEGKINVESSKNLVDYKNINKIMTGSLVGHESWENLVLAAPEMAVLLNQTVLVHNNDVTLENSNGITKKFNETSHENKLMKRKKRDIHSIAIQNAQPHNITTKKAVVTTTPASFEVADMQEFAQLVELQDDEMHGRVALHYLRRYLGPALFNLCELDESTIRHVHLFNSSRIVLAITNFTLERMLVIMTAARTLLNGERRCPKAQLECQVAGARVCLDSMVACDGVPNCGSYDIYDEDRLLCGSSVAMQHNVCLAAFTFLAVLLTLLYAVYYWLKRCVPKVADAFFVYTDGVENILYLDSIMRSPHDTNEEDQNIVYHSQLYEGDGENEGDEETAVPEKTTCQRFLRKLCFCFWKTQNKTETADVRSRKTYSFTELEIRKMISTSKEIAVQTGESLEMKILEHFDNASNCEPGMRVAAASYDSSLMTQNSLLTLKEPLPEEPKDELSLLKFFNNARKDSTGSSSKMSVSKSKAPVKSELTEKEISILNYDRLSIIQSKPSTSKREYMEHVISADAVCKQLRFDEVTTTIPSEEYTDEDEEEGNISADRRRNVVLGESSWGGSRHLDTIEESEELAGGKEHRNFWGTITGKKPKKKKMFYSK